MCGIAGKLVSWGGNLGLTVEKRTHALNSIRHRGPDMQGEYEDGCVWFGHVRLSIIDLSAAANQPMVSADGRYVICYNGEVYNFAELARLFNFRYMRSHSDTEVVLQSFALLGVEVIKQFNGMFAFALYDAYAHKVWLVRDRMGIKPMYYCFDAQSLVFGSEIKAVLSLMNEAPESDLSSLHEWLYYGNALGERTFYKGIKQLEPGHYIELDLTSFTHQVKEYWSLKRQASCSNIVGSSVREMVVETRRLLEEAVRRQLVSDVPIGVFLSGGVDSSAITAIASKHYGKRLVTYSAGFDYSDGVDERPKARKIAKRFGTEHHELYIHGGCIADLVEKMVHHHDMPFSDSANIPLYLMASQISGMTKVVLQGDGGDELFGGYRRYTTLNYCFWLHPIARWAQRFHGVLPESFFRRRMQRYLHAFAAEDIATTMARLLTPVDSYSSPEEIFASPFRTKLLQSDPFVRYRECQQDFADHDIGNQMSFVDLTIVLPSIFLEKVDRSTMAASLEVRVPFLDNDLVDYVVRVSGRKKMPFGKKKWLLKQALQGVIPHDVLYGPKTGFSVPFGYWLRTSLKPLFFDHLAKFNRQWPNVLDTTKIEGMYAAMEGSEHDRANILWNLLNLLVWANNSKVSFVI